LRDQRIEYLTGVVDAYIAERRKYGQNRDIKILKAPGCTLEQKEAIRVKFLKNYLIFSNYASQESFCAESIRGYIRSHTDYRWRDYMVGDVKLCEQLQEGYHPIEPGYNYSDLTPFERQVKRMEAVFGRRDYLLAYAQRYHDKGLRIKVQ
jgi:hypothetical protein